jgi:DNA-binding NtrC family response regulator
MPNLPVQVYIVDDELSVCTAYARIVRSAKMQPRTFESVEEFMHADLSDENACVIPTSCKRRIRFLSLRQPRTLGSPQFL